MESIRSTRSTTLRRSLATASGSTSAESTATEAVQRESRDRAVRLTKRRKVDEIVALSKSAPAFEGDDGEKSSLSSLSPSPPPPTSKTSRKRKAAIKSLSASNDTTAAVTNEKKPKRARKVKIDPTSLEGVEDDVVDTTHFLSRPPDGSREVGWKVGAHVSAAGGVENAPVNAAEIGCTGFALFLKSQRKWTSPPLSPRSIALFKHRMKRLNYNPKTDVLVHGNYLVNLGNPEDAKRKVSYECFLDEIRRCGELGIGLLNIHPGSTVSQTTPENSCVLIAQCINQAHKATEGGVGGDVVVVLENMAGSGNVIGATFEQLADIIKGVEDKSRVGVCFDTCHGFSAGYDFRTKDGWSETMRKFDEMIGLKYLKGMHLNDSKTEFGSRKDRHESIGMGTLTLTSFHHILNDPRTQGIPLVLETPSWEQPKEVWGTEIGVLRRLVGLRVNGAQATGRQREASEENGGGKGDETDTLETLREEVREVIQTVEALNPKKVKVREVKAKVMKGKKEGRKRKMVGSEDEDEGEEDVDEEDCAEEGEQQEAGCCKH